MPPRRPGTPAPRPLWAELDHADVEALIERYDVLPDGLRRRVDTYRADE
jgi:hypothetical protein